MACDVHLIDWGRPWLADWRVLGEAVAERIAQGASVADAANTVAATMKTQAPVQFVPQAALPSHLAYEVYVACRAQVPTRDNLHDFFNALAWLRFPALKRQLNAVHAQAIEREGVGARRGPQRDRATVFDENGALWWAPAELTQALRARRWRDLFVQQRPSWCAVRVTLFGHALLQKLVSPRKAITAHVWCLGSGLGDAPEGFAMADWDAVVDLAPLPVLGVPGWDRANDEPGFYDDALVFRDRVSRRKPRDAPDQRAT